MDTWVKKSRFACWLNVQRKWNMFACWRNEVEIYLQKYIWMFSKRCGNLFAFCGKEYICKGGGKGACEKSEAFSHRLIFFSTNWFWPTRPMPPCFQMNLKPNEKKGGKTEILNFLLKICINQYRTWNGFQWKTSFEKLFDWKTENSLEANQSWASLPSKALGW